MAIASMKALRDAGAVLAGPQPKTIVWTNDAGEEFTFEVLIRPMSFGASLAFSEGADRQQIAQAVSALVLFDDGNGGYESLSYEDALNLHPQLGWLLFEAASASFTDKKK